MEWSDWQRKGKLLILTSLFTNFNSCYFCTWLSWTEFRTGCQVQRAGKLGSQKQQVGNWKKLRNSRNFYWKFIASQNLSSDRRWIVSRATLVFTTTSMQRPYRSSRRKKKSNCRWVFRWRILIHIWWYRRSGAGVADQPSLAWKMYLDSNCNLNLVQSWHLVLGNRPGQRAPFQWKLW